MNVYEAMRIISRDCVGFHADLNIALEEIEDVANAYDALAPDWDDAPEWAQWYAIDADGKMMWYQHEPQGGWQTMWTVFGGKIIGPSSTKTVPIGIDWRLCKWQRPEVK